MNALAPGTALGAYRIVRLLGRGGMGCVYEAEHVGLRARRALKVFSVESEHRDFLRRRFAVEGRILADLVHPRIVRVYDFAVDAATGAPYFAMDLVLSPDGEPQTLEDACRRGGVDEERVAGWFRDICEGLAYIHGKGVVHRDVSLDNVLVGPDGRAVITDFGIAKVTGEDYRRRFDITRTMVGRDGLGMGKGLYLAPELRNGAEATEASDAYALGVLLFRLLEGSWYAPETRLADALAGMDYNWAEVIGRLCAADPAVRLGDGGMAALAVLLRPVAPDDGPRPGNWGAWLKLAVAACVGALALGLVLWLMRRGDGGVPAPVPPPSATIHEIVRHEVTNQVHQIVRHDVTNKVWQVIPVPGRVAEP